MPRCRTMIEPAETSWPSPALMPSRWPTLSRPFFELEPAFLCAIGSGFLLRRPLGGRLRFGLLRGWLLGGWGGGSLRRRLGRRRLRGLVGRLRGGLLGRGLGR